MDNDIVKNSMVKLKRIAQLEDSLSVKQQIKLIEKISQYPAGLLQLLELLISRRLQQIDSLSYIDSIIFKCLRSSKINTLQCKLNIHFKYGIVALESSNNIDYRPLYESLVSNNFKAANQLTQKYLHMLAGLKNKKERQWLYFTDVMHFPSRDLQTIDNLWNIYSEGRFGFSIQKQIWICSGKNWEKFWHKIGWKINERNVRYPNEFIWDITAPAGHLPLFNQIRGVQVLATLFTHPAFKKKQQQEFSNDYTCMQALLK